MYLFFEIILSVFAVFGLYSFIYDIFYDGYVECKHREKEDGDDRKQ